jgi:hypothetical protein
MIAKGWACSLDQGHRNRVQNTFRKWSFGRPRRRWEFTIIKVQKQGNWQGLDSFRTGPPILVVLNLWLLLIENYKRLQDSIFSVFLVLNSL